MKFAGQLLARLGALAYGRAVRLRNRRYDRAGSSLRAELPVLSVGNITTGGTGKTPLVAWLAESLLRMGRRPAIVSRGYGGQAGRGPLLVSSGSGPLCDVTLCGDEPYLLARRLGNVAIVVGSDRLAGSAAAARAGCDVVILDDGFQHRRLARDLDVLLLDASNPFGGYRLLPAGLLREPVDAVTRAHIVLITRSQGNESFTVIRQVVRHYNPEAPILRAGHRPLGFFDASGEGAPRPSHAVAFCGIGNPLRFRIDLEAEGVRIEAFHTYRDHHSYSRGELRKLREIANSRGATLVTTEKDLVRLPPEEARATPPILALRIEALLYDPDPLLDALRGLCAERPQEASL